MRISLSLVGAGLLALAACTDNPVLSPGEPSLSKSSSAAPGAVYVMSNAAAGNEVLAFQRSPKGALTPAGSFPTGGLGTGAGLGSQGAMVLTEDGRWLLAVNAGSDEVTAFRVGPHGLQRTDTRASGGDMPISLTVRRNLVYVLNAGGAGNITGFRLSQSGQFVPIPGSQRPLSGAGVGPAQVQFSPTGRILVVTEKGTNQIVTYQVGVGGIAGPPQPQASEGATPFGFAFAQHDLLVVSEAFGGAPDGSAASSYQLGDDGSLETLSASVPNTETAACWVAVSRDGRYAYTTNNGSSSVSGYSIAPDGTLALLDADGRTGETGPGTAPIDAAFSGNGRYLYVLSAGTPTITGFEYRSDGSLEPAGSITGLPAGTVGLAAQ